MGPSVLIPKCLRRIADHDGWGKEVLASTNHCLMGLIDYEDDAYHTRASGDDTERDGCRIGCRAGRRILVLVT